MTRNLDATPIPGHDARLDRQSHATVDDKMCHVDRVKLLQDGSKCNIAGVHDRQPHPADSAHKFLPTMSAPQPEKGAKPEAVSKAESLLLNHSAKPEERLKAASELVHQGVHSLKVTDDKGHESTLRLDSSKMGNREMVHVFVKDGKHEKVALRGNLTDHGMEEQRDVKGKHVGMEGKGAEAFKHMHAVDGTPQKEAPVPPRKGPEQHDAPPVPPRKAPDQHDAPPLPPRRQELHTPPNKPPQDQGKDAPLPPRKAPEQHDPADAPKPAPKPAPVQDERRRQQDVAPKPDKPDGADQSFFPGKRPDVKPDSGVHVTSLAERNSFYKHQTTPVDCSAVSMGEALSHHRLGRPLTDSETVQMRRLAGVTEHGYRGSLDTMAHQMERTGLNAKAYEYSSNFSEKGMADLNRELAAGHSAVARVINTHTGNPHYIYIAGRDGNGNYIVGDPDRKNNGQYVPRAGRVVNHDKPMSAQELYTMMRGRNGFVAAW